MIKKISIFIFASVFFITVLIFADKVSNNKISESVSLLYLYFTSPGEVLFEKMLIPYPYNYTISLDQDSLILQQYPKKDVIIIFKKSNLSNFNDFFDSYSYRLENLGFNLIKNKSKEIHGKLVQSLIGRSKTDNSEYKAYIYIPFNRVVVEFIGSVKSSTEFWDTVESIRFNSNI